VLLNHPSTTASELRNAEKENLLGVPYFLPFGNRTEAPERLAEQPVNFGLQCGAALLLRFGAVARRQIVRATGRSFAERFVEIGMASPLSPLTVVLESARRSRKCV
jgi:hypothetical protein